MIGSLLLLVIAIIVPSHGQATLPSPCPYVFKYEPTTNEPGRWYGVINLSADNTLYSLALNIVLDGKADILGNWLGDVITDDNTAFTIVKPDMKLHPGPAVPVRFFVQYNPLLRAPRLIKITLNDRDICDANALQPAVGPVSKPSIRQQPESDPAASIPDRESYPKKPTYNRPSTINYYPNYPSYNKYFNPDEVFGGNRRNQNNECGKVVHREPAPLLANRISGGMPTMEGQWPWHIALYQTQSVDIKYTCGGTLVTQQHIVTAAHCVTVWGSKQVYDKNTFIVFLGKHNLRTFVEGVQIRLLSNIIIHPAYTPSTFNRDVSILTMRKPADYTDFVRPICLWPENRVDLENVVGKKGLVVGWGINESEAASEELALVEMPIVDSESCLRSNGNFFVKHTSNYTYCAGYRDGTSVCNGDSGGGMVFKIGDTWHLRGLVSVSVARGPQARCDPSHYVIFTDLAKHLPWIEQNTNN